MLYPVLHRLERQGHVAAKWSASENGRRRKYYRITKEGRAQLAPSGSSGRPWTVPCAVSG
jgi:DNA-binding PadR family transcriptional regulator